MFTLRYKKFAKQQREEMRNSNPPFHDELQALVKQGVLNKDYYLRSILTNSYWSVNNVSDTFKVDLGYGATLYLAIDAFLEDPYITFRIPESIFAFRAQLNSSWDLGQSSEKWSEFISDRRNYLDRRKNNLEAILDATRLQSMRYYYEDFTSIPRSPLPNEMPKAPTLEELHRSYLAVPDKRRYHYPNFSLTDQMLYTGGDLKLLVKVAKDYVEALVEYSQMDTETRKSLLSQINQISEFQRMEPKDFFKELEPEVKDAPTPA